MDATKLADLQSDCYQGVRDLFDTALPELDRKLALLRGEKYPSQKLSKSISTTFHPQAKLREAKQMPSSKTCNDLREVRTHNTLHEVKEHEPSTRVKPNLDELEHLRPLPMPLSHYLKANRPELVKAADRRVMYLKRKAERRRQIASSKSISARDILGPPSRASSNRGTSSLRSSLRSSPRTISRDNVAPNYQVRYKLSEHEMKRLTARVYNRLPEVKRQRNEEVTKHMKVQNYKNKMEYGRKLLMNRKRGVINYPLRTNNDDSISSQEESLTNSLE